MVNSFQSFTIEKFQPPFLEKISNLGHFIEVRFASFLSGGFLTAISWDIPNLAY